MQYKICIIPSIAVHEPLDHHIMYFFKQLPGFKVSPICLYDEYIQVV